MNQVELIKELDANGNCIHYRHNSGYECWYKYNAKGKLIHRRDSNGFEEWREHDAKDNCIHYRDSLGREFWYWKGKMTEDPIKILLLKAKLMKKDVLSE